MAKKTVFTNDELEYIKNEYISGKSINKLANEFNVGYGVIQNRLKKMYVFKYSNKRWSLEDISFLEENYASADWDVILSKLSKWKKSEIISKASRLNLKRESFFWNECDIETLKECYEQKCSVQDIERKLNYKFTQCAILTKAHVLGLRQKEPWTIEEDARLQKIYSIYDMNQICNEFPNRSYDAIIQRAVVLGLSYKTTWTDDELQFLIGNHRIMSDDEIACYLGRTKDSVRGKRFAEKLYHPVEPGIYNYLSEYIRKRNKDWKQKSSEQCNYKCAVTGKRFQEIHHLYGMNKILQETLHDLNYPENISIKELSDDDLNIILNHFYEVQDTYPLGICLSRDIHKEFHDCYGYGDNTPEQFEEFLKTHNYTLKIA